ncbi:MAG: methyltransferase domain-containing protein [Clostridia bacterium]|nr:methyltransferase domain-containing protein [Clostridia bacterium]
MTKFICPICKEPLTGEKSLRCSNNHCFDRAKGGYINLLSGKGGNHGDPKDMILARKNFLDKGYYEPLRNAIADTAADLTQNECTVLDCGCGECYYTQKIKELLPHAHIMGLDVSKDAVNYGCKRSKELDLAVASVYAMPIADSSIDTAVSIFAPCALEEFIRVLKPGGHLVMAIGGENHLWSLKKAVYDTPYKNETSDYLLCGFDFVGKKELKYQIDLNSTEDIKNLFSMTPYYHKTAQSDIAKLDRLTHLNTEIEFEILIYKKISA